MQVNTNDLPCSRSLRAFRSWWWTGRLGILQSMWSERVGHDWATELNWTEKTLNGRTSELITPPMRTEILFRTCLSVTAWAFPLHLTASLIFPPKCPKEIILFEKEVVTDVVQIRFTNINIFKHACFHFKKSSEFCFLFHFMPVFVFLQRFLSPFWKAQTEIKYKLCNIFLIKEHINAQRKKGQQSYINSFCPQDNY